MTIEELKAAFVYAYKQKADVVYFASDSINLIGEHIIVDRNSLISCTLSNGIYLLLHKNNQKQVRFWSLNNPEVINIDLQKLQKHKSKTWVKYPVNLLIRFIKQGLEIKEGFNILVWGNIPEKSNVSASDALQAITAFALFDQLDISFNNKFLKEIGINAVLEFDFINKQLFSHNTSVDILGTDFSQLMYEPLELNFRPLKMEDVKIIISNTHTPHRVDASTYYQRISECKIGFEYLNNIQPIHNWDELKEEDFKSLLSIINNPAVIKSLYHMISEVHRTKVAIKAIKEGDLNTFGRLMNASHASLRDNLEIVSSEVDAMVAEACKIEGVIGSRMAGCGFGGCTISLVKEDNVDTFIKKVGRIYEEETCIKNNFFVAEIGDCACKLHQ